jgi:hypothetical protein
MFHSERENPCFGIRRIKMYERGMIYCDRDRDNTRWHLQNKACCVEALYVFL